MDHVLILASASPQRKQLLEGLGVSFQVVPSTVEERDCTERDPALRAQVLARMKAQDVARRYTDTFVIGCDTLVVAADASLLEKPEDETEARTMLMKHSGQTCIVHSGLAVMEPNGALHEGVSSSSVTFKSLSDGEMDWWIGTGLWRDRSGGFQIDGLGQLMIQRLEGDFTGVVGLPIFLLGELLATVGYALIA